MRLVRAWAQLHHPTDRGASAVEYGLLVAGIAAVIFAAIFLFGDSVLALFVESCTAVDASVKTGTC